MLSDRDIKMLIKIGRLVVKPLLEDTIRENGLDLRLGRVVCVARSLDDVVDASTLRSWSGRRIEEFFECSEVDDDGVVIYPGEVALLHTEEYIKLPNDVVGFCNLRSTLARLGLYIPPTVVDAGFEGQLVIEVRGSRFPVRLKPGMRFLHLILLRTCSPVERPYRGKYQSQRGVTLARPDIQA